MSDATRDRLLRVAAAHFARQGYDGASLRRIGEAAGISASSIFHHFPGGKQSLYDAIMDDVATTVGERIFRRYGSDAGLSPEDAVVQMAAAFWDFFADHPDYARLILQQAADDDRTRARFMENEARMIVEGAEAFIHAAQREGHLGQFDARHFLLWATGHTLVTHASPFMIQFVMPGRPLRELREGYLGMVRTQLRGLVVPSKSQPPPPMGPSV